MLAHFFSLQATKGVAVAALSSLVTLLLGEVALRFYIPAPIISGMTQQCENSERYGWGFPPEHPIPRFDPDTRKTSGMDFTNSQGWKDVDHELNKAKGTIRILVVGDSNTFGVTPLEETYPRVLEGLLREEGFPVEVISIACNGWSTDQELEAYLQEGVYYRPDIVISQFCGNDLSGNMGLDGINDTTLKPFRYFVEEGDLKVVRFRRSRALEGSFHSLHRFSLTHSRIYLTAHRALDASRNDEGGDRSRLWFLQERVLAGGAWKPGEDDDPTRAQWELYGSILRSWRERCDQESSRLYSFCESFEPQSLEFLLKWEILRREGETILARTPEGEWAEIDYTKPVYRHREVCESSGVTVIPRNREYPRFQWDPHPNAEGNRAIAEDIRDFLTEDPDSRTLLESATRNQPSPYSVASQAPN